MPSKRNKNKCIKYYLEKIILVVGINPIINAIAMVPMLEGAFFVYVV